MNGGVPLVKNICCIGAGYVGGPTMAVIAAKCPEITINVVDVNQKRISDWNSEDLANLPIYEPGLSEIIEIARNRNLFFSNEIAKKISEADMVFISVNTPTKTKGLGAGLASDLRWVESCARQVAEFAKERTIVVEKSTLPVRTAQVIKSILDSCTSKIDQDKKIKSFSVLSNPEFLSEGTAIDDLELPDRVLIGGEDKLAIEALTNIYLNWVPKTKIITTNLWSSELSKLIANAFLAQRVSSINSVSAICEATGADVREVADAVGMDSRIGRNFLNTGPGFGGSCFKKDILNLVYICKYLGLEEVANYWEKVVEINTWQKKRISQKIVQNLFGTVAGKKIALLGYAFKANTNDTRETPAKTIAEDLIEEGAILAIHDPKVDVVNIQNDLGPEYKGIDYSQVNNGVWSYYDVIEEAVKGADAIIILTDWDIYRRINWDKITSLMRYPAWIFDTRLVINKENLNNNNLNLWQLGTTN